MPDLAAGSQNLVATGALSGAIVTSTGAITYDPRIDNQPATTATQALSSVAGTAGSTTILRTGTNFGAHGLYANTAYQIVWNEESNTPGTSGKVLASFTSTATGGIPVPGVQFAVPADTSGIHIIGLERTSTPGTSFQFADNGLSGAAVYTDSDSALGATFQTNFGDMLFNLGTSLIATPTVANVGGTVAISGTGLQANTLYDLSLNIAGGSPPSTCTTPGSTISGQFTSTSSGTVPSGVSLGITDMPTASGLEQGTLYCVFAQTPANFGPSGSVAGTSQFLLEASANLNATSGPIGHNFIETAHGLNANTGYNILFAPYQCGSSSICGTVVGAILSNAQGAGSATFTIPSAVQSGAGSSPTNTGSTYTIQLQKTGTSSGVALAIPPTFTVSSTSITSCNTTTCMSASGSPQVIQINQNKAVQTSFTNTSNAPVTAIVYAVVHNAAGQTVAYSTATVTANAGATATAYDVLFGLAPGTYSVTIFATSTGGTAISSTSTVTVTV